MNRYINRTNNASVRNFNGYNNDEMLDLNLDILNHDYLALEKDCQKNIAGEIACNSPYFWQNQVKMYYPNNINNKPNNYTWRKYFESLDNKRYIPVIRGHDNIGDVEVTNHFTYPYINLDSITQTTQLSDPFAYSLIDLRNLARGLRFDEYFIKTATKAELTTSIRNRIFLLLQR